jgi:hypothetical protein
VPVKQCILSANNPGQGLNNAFFAYFGHVTHKKCWNRAGLVKRLLTAAQKHAKHNPGGRGQASIQARPQVKKVTFYQ